MSAPHRPPSSASSGSGAPGTPAGTAPGAKTAGADVVRIPRPAGGPGRGGPFAGMNVPAEKAMNFWPSARRLMGTLRQLNADRGVTIIIVTHDAGVAGATDRVVRLTDGRVVADERRDTRAFTRALAGEPASNGGPRVWARLGDLLEKARGR